MSDVDYTQRMSIIQMSSNLFEYVKTGILPGRAIYANVCSETYERTLDMMFEVYQ